jgi:hypothetical protein
MFDCVARIHCFCHVIFNRQGSKVEQIPIDMDVVFQFIFVPITPMINIRPEFMRKSTSADIKKPTVS